MPNHVYSLSALNGKSTFDLNDVSMILLSNTTISVRFKDNHSLYMRFASEERANQEYFAVSGFWKKV